MKRILVTGSTGFVGGHLISHLLSNRRKYEIVAATRRPLSMHDPRILSRYIQDINSSTPWGQALVGVDTVVHTAAMVHVLRHPSSEVAQAFYEVNTAGTLNLARQAASKGVRRLIYLSSIKVNGEGRALDEPYTADEQPNPDLSDPYVLSKLEAEKGLWEIATRTGMEVVIIRPPLVYGSGVKANFYNLMVQLHRGIPLPFANINNKRSFVFVMNLVILIEKCISHPAAANQVFLASDGEDLSTTELVTQLADAMEVPLRLFYVPSGVMKWGAELTGKRHIYQRLYTSLQVDIAKNITLLNWFPYFRVDEGFRLTAGSFVAHLKNMQMNMGLTMR